ncbi:hypothetical protein CFC21_041146 [Triticum aestivum]|uniref:RNase H type-1 domain-containing protein n=2 Tax=Triticum aestivum TaxID=4565 RepID=A0A9R1FII0_WHEAT|nr:hypothetical protein CFC21_041146 [Triticum aestivum]
MILRDSSGHIVFSSCRHLFSCVSALEAEVEACKEGVALALEWSTLPFILETGCSVAAAMIVQPEVNISPVSNLVQEIKHLLARGRSHTVAAISRVQNSVSHMLAKIGRTGLRTTVWLRSGPEEIVNLCAADQIDPI